MKEINLEESQVLQVRNLNLNSQSMWEKPPQINMRPGNGSASGKEPTCQCWKYKKCRTDPWVRKISWRRVWKPLQYSCLENPMDRRAWWATVHRIVFVSSGELDMPEHSCMHCKNVRTPCLIFQISKLFWASVFSWPIRAVTWSGNDKSIWVTVLPSSLQPCTSCWLG